MPRIWSFHLPTRIEFGRGVARRLGELAARIGRRALVVGYCQAGPLAAIYHRAMADLGRAGVHAELLLAAEPEPTVAHLSAAVAKAAPRGADLIVGLGGGSVLDLAKGIAACLASGARLLDCLEASGDLPEVTEALPLLAVPTTAGTGAEATCVAVFTSPTDPPVKRSLVGPALVPRLAVVDPDLALSNPPELVAQCAADALGHALETACSRSANPLTTLFSHQAVALLLEHLPRAVASAEDREAREALAMAALLAGAALNDAGVVVGHVLAHGLGAVLHVPHGLAVATSILPTLRFNAPVCTQRYAALADACALGGESADDKAQRLLDAVAQVLRSAGLPAYLAAPQANSEALLDRLVQSGSSGTRIGLTLNPQKVPAQALRTLFAQCLRPTAGPQP